MTTHLISSASLGMKHKGRNFGTNLFLSSFIIFVYFVHGYSATKKAKSSFVAEIPGDIMLGGLFPVHTTGSTVCEAINPERGIQRVEAMLYTLDEINNDTSLLPGLRLGATIRDTCSDKNFALGQMLNFVFSPSGGGDSSGGRTSSSKATNKDRPSARGVVGSSYSSVSITAAGLFRLFNLPQISYASTSAVLSDKKTYPLFARTVPSDVVQARAMAALVSWHNWTYVSTVRSTGDYGESGMDAFWREADKLGICIAARELIRDNARAEDVDAVVKVLRQGFSKARVVVLFTGMDHTKMLLDAVRRAGFNDHFVWIASDGWGRENVPVANNSRVANGALTIEIQARPITTFSDYYLNLGFYNPRNPWFQEYWEELFQCTFSDGDTSDGELLSRIRRYLQQNHDQFTKLRVKRREPKRTKPPCKLDQNLKLRDKLGADFRQEAKIQFVYDAVYALAVGLDILQRRLCPGNPLSPYWDKQACIEKLLSFHGKEFYNIVINTSFTDKSGNYVDFDSNGDGYGQYSIYNYARQPYTGLYEYRHVGDYQAGKLTIHARPIWPGGQSAQTPPSQCSEECGFGEVRRLDKKQQCCWSCELCAENQRIVNKTHCETCPFQHWPSKNRTTCELLDLHYIEMSTWFGIVPVTFSSLGICLTIAVIATWYIYAETPVIRATGRELAYVQLSGCMVSYCTPFVILANPSILTCTIQRISIGLGCVMMYASLLTKTVRIARIFEAAKHTTRRPVYISPRSQLVIASVLISVQISFTAIWFGFDAPDTRIDEVRPGYLVLRCAMKDKSFLMSLVYSMFLIIACTVYAVKTRQIPENFNESKFIGFSMYTTCVIWLAFIPMYYATMHNYQIQITTLCITVDVSATVMLCCLYFPKLYIVYVRPDKNIRRLTMNNPKAKDKLMGQQKQRASAVPFSNTLTGTSSTREDEEADVGQSMSLMDSDMSNLKSTKRVPQNSYNSIQPARIVDVIKNPLNLDNLIPKATDRVPLVQEKSPDLRPTARTNTVTPNINNDNKRSSVQVKPNQVNPEFPTPTPLMLDNIPQRVLLAPTYCDESSSAADEEYNAGVECNREFRTSKFGTSSSSQTLINQYATPFSPTTSIGSEDTPRSSDSYTHSYGEENNPVPSSTGSGQSTSGSVFSQMRPPAGGKPIKKVDYTKQTVTAL